MTSGGDALDPRDFFRTTLSASTESVVRRAPLNRVGVELPLVFREDADVADFQAGLAFEGGQKGAELREGRVRQEPPPRRGMRCGRFAAIFPHAQLILPLPPNREFVLTTGRCTYNFCRSM